MIYLIIPLVLNPIPSSIQNLWLSVVVIVVVVVVVVLIANVHVNRNWYLSGSWSSDNFLLVNHALLQQYITVSWILGWVSQGLYPVWLISSYMARYSTIFDGCTPLPLCALLKGPNSIKWKKNYMKRHYHCYMSCDIIVIKDHFTNKRTRLLSFFGFFQHFGLRSFSGRLLYHGLSSFLK